MEVLMNLEEDLESLMKMMIKDKEDFDLGDSPLKEDALFPSKLCWKTKLAMSMARILDHVLEILDATLQWLAKSETIDGGT